MPITSWGATGLGTTTPAETDQYDLGTTVLVWKNLYLGDAGKFYIGTAQDISLYRGAAGQLNLDVSSANPALQITQAGAGYSLYLKSANALGNGMRIGSAADAAELVYRTAGAAGVDFNNISLVALSSASVFVVPTIVHSATFSGIAGAVKIQTRAANGDIQFAPNGSGQIDAQAAIYNSTASNDGRIRINDELEVNLSIYQRYDAADANGPNYQFLKSRGTRATPLTVVAGDDLGQLDWRGHDGTSYVASVVQRIDTLGYTIGTGRVPADWILSTLPDTASPSLAERLRASANGNIVIGAAALATTVTDGFLYLPSCAGTPTGTPTAYTGRAPVIVDTTNHKLMFNDGSWRESSTTHQLLVKTADELVNNSTTLQSDDKFTFAIGANETWIAELHLLLTAGAADGFSFQITTPAGSAGVASYEYYSTNAIQPGGSVAVNVRQDQTSVNGLSLLHIYVTVRNGATAGSVTLQWAQQTATVVDTKVLTDSHMVAHRVS